jgi:hypothetical protein
MEPFDNSNDRETDDRFPSGMWRGYFLQPQKPGEHAMELQLVFRGGTIRGEGRDWVGEFTIRGSYSTTDGKCSWIKQYLAKHMVAYKGYGEGRGIWGTWDMYEPGWRGGFQIWPVGHCVGGDSLVVEEEVEAPALVGAMAGGMDEDSFSTLDPLD